MAGKYSSGKHAIAISDRSGLQFPYTEMVREWTGLWVHISEFESKQPQLELKVRGGDAQALEHPRPPERTAPAVLISLPPDPFETYLAASAIINVNSPDHGRSASDTVRFRGPPFVSSETNKFNNCSDVDGISGSVICQAAGYTISLGKYVSGAAVSSDDWYYFTAASGSATTGGLRGGGTASAGPVTITA